MVMSHDSVLKPTHRIDYRLTTLMVTTAVLSHPTKCLCSWYYAPVWEQFSDFLAYLHEHLFPILPQVAPNEETCALSILVHVHRQI